MDKKIIEILEKEKNRQKNNIELIASENYVSESIMTLQGSIFTNKYAEGYPGKRYYGGCENMDMMFYMFGSYKKTPAYDLSSWNVSNVITHTNFNYAATQITSPRWP